jgi:hypothetical protein
VQAQSSPASPTIPTTEAASQPTVEPLSSAIVSAEDESLIAALIAEDLESLDLTVEENTGTDVVAPVNTADLPADTLAAAAGTDSGAVPPEEPTSEQPALEGAEAAPAPPAAETSNDDAQSDSSEEDEIVKIRPVPFYYGFVQLFDAHAQDFLVHGDFLAQPGDNVKDFIRKHLGYADDKNFLVWRRGNAYRLTSVQASSTFEDIRDESSYRHDGFVLVVGDVLSDST